jgi:hypothetical protein
MWRGPDVQGPDPFMRGDGRCASISDLTIPSGGTAIMIAIVTRKQCCPAKHQLPGAAGFASFLANRFLSNSTQREIQDRNLLTTPIPQRHYWQN